MRKIDSIKKRFIELGIDTALNVLKGSRICAKKTDNDFEAHLVALSCRDSSDQNGNFVACIGIFLKVYKRPYDPLFPLVCMDESHKKLISETYIQIPEVPSKIAKYDYECKRCGICNILCQ